MKMVLLPSSRGGETGRQPRGVYSSRSLSEMDLRMLKHIKFVVEQHEDTFLAYPLGIQGGVVGEGDTAAAALEDARSATEFYIETLGAGVIEDESPLSAFVSEQAVSVK